MSAVYDPAVAEAEGENFEPSTWLYFVNAGMLDDINHILGTRGWAICAHIEENEKGAPILTGVLPYRKVIKT